MNFNKKMSAPKSLYRYRPLGDSTLVDRELKAICGSYLYAPSFEQMNDPMEALFEFLGSNDPMGAILPTDFLHMGKRILEETAKTARSSGLISMSETYLDYPLWAYYGSNFAGMCLEFDTQELLISYLPIDSALPIPVIYNSKAPAPITFEMLTFCAHPMDLVMNRLSQKREEWKHEKEWRYLAGKVGQKVYTDTALKRIYLGPKIDPKVKLKIVEAMEKRPVEILEGSINGYEIEFSSIKAPTPWHECEMTRNENFNPINVLSSLDKELCVALGDNYKVLVQKCNELSTHPNVLSIDKVCFTKDKTICLTVRYRLRGKSGHIPHKYFFDINMNPITIHNCEQLY